MLFSGAFSATPSGISVSSLDMRFPLSSYMLKAVALAPGLEVIGVGWFCETNIMDVTIPASVREIREDAFRNCVSLTRVYLHRESRLERIGARAFQNTDLSSFTAPPNLRELAQCAFYNCKKLKKVKLNDGLERLGTLILQKTREYCGGVFEQSALSSISLPQSLKWIGPSAFRRCVNL